MSGPASSLLSALVQLIPSFTYLAERCSQIHSAVIATLLQKLESAIVAAGIFAEKDVNYKGQRENRSDIY